jgi:hypothetical protein
MEVPTALSRAAFRRRLLIVLLLILLVLLLALGFAGGGSGQVREFPPGQPMPSPSFSPTFTPLPPELFTVVVKYATRPVFIETHTFSPTGTPTDTPSPENTRTHTPNPVACQGHGRDLGDNWLVAGCDNLSYISRRTGIPLADLLAANPWIANPDLIYPGELIQLPRQR